MESCKSFWFISFLLFSLVFAQPQVNDQFDPSPEPEINSPTIPKETLSTQTPGFKEDVTNAQTTSKPVEETPTPVILVQQIVREGPIEPSFFEKFIKTLKNQIIRFITTPKISVVLRNMATCVVNGVMEIVSFYFPAPLIPLIASAAGMIIPFEPVLMLRDRMPVTSYRRAFSTALSTFLGTFDKYKLEDNYEYDPYMTQRFHRRMMSYGSGEKDKEEKPKLKE